MKPTEYRCSCCDKVKTSKGDKVFRVWEPRSRHWTTVAICKTCDAAIHDHRIGVKDFVKFKERAES